MAKLPENLKDKANTRSNNGYTKAEKGLSVYSLSKSLYKEKVLSKSQKSINFVIDSLSIYAQVQPIKCLYWFLLFTVHIEEY